MKKIAIFLTCLIILISIITSLPHKPKYLVDTYSKYDLDLDNKQEAIHFYTKEIEFGNWETDIFINDFHKPATKVKGLLRNNRFHDISNNIRILELEISAGGKLVNSLLYQYLDGQLIRIPLIPGSPSQTWDIWRSGEIEFLDKDNDGIKEMLVYNRHYPPEAKRTVEEYKFNQSIFQKVQEYEEIMPSIYY